MKYIFTLFLLSLASLSFSQLNMELISNVQYGTDGNDIWAYIAPNGDEYAVVGTRTGTRIYSLEDPANPIEKIFIPGTSSTWRDMKQWGEYLYVTCDTGNDGLLIIDMQQAQDTIIYNYINPKVDNVVGQDTFPLLIGRCHNIFIDEKGLICLAGCEGTRGVEFFDPTNDPMFPEYLGSIQSPYSHDAYAKGDTLYSSEIYDHLAIYDISDLSNIELLGTQKTSSDFTHNAWADPTNSYVFTTDERPEGFLDAYDVSDPGNIKFLDKFMPPGMMGTGTIPHNTHWYEGFLVTSWYTSGVVVIDANKPDNLVQVAFYDTYDGPNGGFNGCWGATPYLPSGILLANDINTGLYVFDIDYVRASYLEGVVTNSETNETISGVRIEILEGDENDEILTMANGMYKTGQVTSGSFDVVYSHPAYLSDTITVNLITAECVNQDVALTPLPTYQYSFTVIDSFTKQPIEGAKVFTRNNEFSYELSTNADGLAQQSFLGGTYEIFVGAWGYKNYQYSSGEVNTDISNTFEIAPSYMDDFILDLGWEVTNNPEPGLDFTGFWERTVPIQTQNSSSIFSPGNDVLDDIGNMCYLTENGGGLHYEFDVDNGETILTSPSMDLTEYVNPKITLSAWLVNAPNQGLESDDYLKFYLTNGIEEVLVLTYEQVLETWNDDIEFIVGDYLDITDNVKLKITISDFSNSGHVVEAGIDNFFVSGAPEQVVGINNSSNKKLKLYPNPTNDLINIESESNILSVQLIDIYGKVLLTTSSNKLSVDNISSGQYFARIVTEGGYIETMPVSIIK